MTPGRRSNRRVRDPSVIALVLAALASTAAAHPLTWGAEVAVHGDFSTTSGQFIPDSRRYFPPSASVVGQVHWTGPAGVRIAAGAGYEQWVRTRHLDVTLVLGPDELTLEVLSQVRERSLIIPLELELPIAAWSLSPGIRWQHVVGYASRIKGLRFTSSTGTDEFGPEPWEEGDPSVADRWSATFTLARTWRGDAGTRSIGLRWAHGLTDIHTDPDLELFQRSLQLVLGWSR